MSTSIFKLGTRKAVLSYKGRLTLASWERRLCHQEDNPGHCNAAPTPSLRFSQNSTRLVLLLGLIWIWMLRKFQTAPSPLDGTSWWYSFVWHSLESCNYCKLSRSVTSTIARDSVERIISISFFFSFSRALVPSLASTDILDHISHPVGGASKNIRATQESKM